MTSLENGLPADPDKCRKGLCVSEGGGMSNPAVKVEEPSSPVENNAATAVTFVSGFNNEDDNLVQQAAAAAAAADDDDEVNEEIPLVAAAAGSVRTLLLLSWHTSQVTHTYSVQTTDKNTSKVQITNNRLLVPYVAITSNT